jgi:hypothetical protein
MVVVPATPSPPRDFEEGKSHKLVITTPRLDTDGFYIIRVSVAGKSSDGAQDERTVETYWSVSSGRLAQLDYSEWFKLSNVSKAVKL